MAAICKTRDGSMLIHRAGGQDAGEVIEARRGLRAGPWRAGLRRGNCIPMARGMDRVFRTVVDRTRSRLDVPALRTPFRIRRRPEGTGQPSPKLFADRKPKAATGVSRADRRGSCPYGDERSRRGPAHVPRLEGAIESPRSI
jgi:hypothetical protein